MAPRATKKAPAEKKAKAPAKKTRKPAKRTGKVLLSARQLKTAINKLAAEIIEEFPSPEQLVILGIRTRGIILADRIRAILEKKYKTTVHHGELDITFYRDDLSRLGPRPTVHGSTLPFDITDIDILLVDDVLFTGRTVRAALDEISDFGRPGMVRLVTLVDRGCRELPIQADYCALKLDTDENQRVHVMFEESDDDESVFLETVKT